VTLSRSLFLLIPLRCVLALSDLSTVPQYSTWLMIKVGFIHSQQGNMWPRGVKNRPDVRCLIFYCISQQRQASYYLADAISAVCLCLCRLNCFCSLELLLSGVRLAMNRLSVMVFPLCFFLTFLALRPNCTYAQTLSEHSIFVMV